MNKLTYVVTSTELYHHGILGQKWGVRRYQNKDGTLTEAGKERYFKSHVGLRYELNDRGKRIEAREFANKYSTKQDKTLEKKIERVKKDMENDFWWYQSSKSLQYMVDHEKEYATNSWAKHIDAINHGELFTRKYYETKIDAITGQYKGEAASKILAERKRLYDKAKNDDSWSIDYLEIRPDNIAESSDKKAKLRDYESWLNDPRAYVEKRYA